MPQSIGNLLSNYGFNLIALPNDGVKPLLLLYKKGGNLGSIDSDLSELFRIDEIALPQAHTINTVQEIEGNANVSLDTAASLDLLEWLLSKLNMGKVKADLKTNSTYKVSISYKNVQQDSVSLLKLDGFLNGSKPNVDGLTTFEEKLKNSKLYVINAILKSDNMFITIEASNGQIADLETTIKGIADATASVHRKADNAITIRYTNPGHPLAFAFQAQQIIYDEKQWWQSGDRTGVKFRIRDVTGVTLKGVEDIKTFPLSPDDNLAAI